ELSNDQISAMFWINVTAGVAMMLITCTIARGVAWFYEEPRLTWITIAYAVGFVFSGLTVQHEALLRRRMRFTALATAEILSLVAALLAAVALAWRGVHYWALVFNQLVQGLVYLVAVWIICGWRPGLPAGYTAVRSLLVFGGNLTGFGIIN